MKNKLLSISAKALKLCEKKTDMWMLSFYSLHEMVGRATPDKIFGYKLALQLYKVVNNNVLTPDWININFNDIHTSRQTIQLNLLPPYLLCSQGDNLSSMAQVRPTG